MAMVRVNGVDLRVSHYPCRAGGRPPVVVFIHGLTVDHSGLGLTLGMPLSAGAEVILYDLRGHGRSQFVPSGYRVADHLADLQALLQALGIDSPVHLVAGSYGGVIAATLARWHPERVASLSLIEGMVPHSGWGELVGQAMDRAAETLDHDYTAEEAMEALGISSPRKAMGLARRAERLLLETTLRDDVLAEEAFDDEDYAAIGCPVLGIYGDGSHLYPLAQVLPTLIPGARIHTIPGANHLQVFLHTRALKPLIGEFVEMTAGGLPATRQSYDPAGTR